MMGQFNRFKHVQTIKALHEAKDNAVSLESLSFLSNNASSTDGLEAMILEDYEHRLLELELEEYFSENTIL